MSETVALHNETYASIRELRNNIPGIKSFDGVVRYLVDQYMDIHKDEDVTQALVRERTRKFIKGLINQDLTDDKTRIEYVIIESLILGKHQQAMSLYFEFLKMPTEHRMSIMNWLESNKMVEEKAAPENAGEAKIGEAAIQEEVGFDFQK